MQVHEIMTHHPETVDVTATVRDAVDRLFRLDVRHLPVLEEGEVVGMLSDRDLRNRAASYSPEALAAPNPALDEPVSSIMRGDVSTVAPDSSVAEAIDYMLETRDGALPVVDPDEGNLVGIVSYIDILRGVRDLVDDE